MEGNMSFSILKAVDGLGRIVIPIELRKHYGIDLHDEVELIPTASGILIAKKDSSKGEAATDITGQ